MSVLRFAWRNLWRNRKRTSITVAAVTLNTAILIMSYSLMEGLLARAVSYATDLIVGEVQVHADGYRRDRSLYRSIPDPERILARADEAGAAGAARSFAYGLASTGTKSAGALFWGVDPTAERQAFDLARHVDQGTFLEPDPDKRIVLGKTLARSLHAEPGSEIVVVLQAADGSLGNDIYRVCGVLKIAGESFDRSAAILHMQDFQEIAVLGGRIHEIALNSHGTLPPEEIALTIRDGLEGMDVQTWRELLPTLSDMVRLSRGAIWLFGGIFFLTGALGVMNTMIMATYERFREFGIMKALGTTPLQIVRDVTVEAFLLVLIATGAGILLGLAGTWYLHEHGIDTSRWASSITAAGVAFDPHWRADFSFFAVAGPVVAMWFASIAAALYPAAIAARLDPVRAMRKN